MVSASQAFHDAVRDGAPQRALLFFDDYTFTNDDLSSAGIHFEEYYCGETDLTFGLTPSASISFTLMNDTGALNGFSGGEFTAWLGARTESAAYKSKALCHLVGPDGCVYEGFKREPYLRVDGAACEVQPDFPVHAMIWTDDAFYCIGAGGEAAAWSVHGGDVPSSLPTWRMLRDRVSTWRKARTWYLFGQSALVRATPMMTADAEAPDSAFWAGKAQLWADRGVGVVFSRAGKTLTEWRGGGMSKFEFVPLGVFLCERPARVKTRLIAVEGYDRMALLESELPSTFEPEASQTLTAQMNSLCDLYGVTWDGVIPLNRTLAPYSVPGTNGMTGKEYLSLIAEAACANARFDREGVLRLDFMEETERAYDENGYSAFTPAEYHTATPTKIQARNSDQDVGTIVGTGTETYVVHLNPFLTGRTSALQAILDRIASLPEYTPSTAALFTDWALRAGDWITILQGAESFRVPVMRMTMTWTGQPKIEIEATGREHRETVSAANRQEYRSGYAIHEVTNSFETFRSYIQSPEGAASIVEQSASAIQLSASQIALEGYTTINRTFTIDSEGYLTCTGGTIGGFVIESTRLRSSNNNIILSSDGTLTCRAGDIGGFSVTSTEIKSTNENLILNSSGTLTCRSGTIGGFTITGSSISSSGTNPNIILRSDGTAKIGDLTVSGSRMDFKGTVHAGNIVSDGNDDRMPGGYLKNGTVKTSQLADLAVTSGKLNTGAVTTTKIGDDQVTSAKLDTVYATDARVSHILSGNVTATTLSATNLKLGTQGSFKWLGQDIRTYPITDQYGRTVQALGFILV